MSNNRLAPNAYNALYSRVPDPTARTPEYTPPLGIRQQLENVSAGLGRGAVTQLQDVQALVSDPRAYATNTLRGMRELMRNPALIGNVLRDTARRAKSGPLGLGEVVGEMLPLRPGKKAPSTMKVAREVEILPHPNMRDNVSIVDKNAPDIRLSVGPSFMDEYEYVSPSLEAYQDAAKGKGTATRLYLEGLKYAQKIDRGWQSETPSFRSDNAEKIYARLIKLGVPFKYEDGLFYIPEDELKNIDIDKIISNFDKQR